MKRVRTRRAAEAAPTGEGAGQPRVAMTGFVGRRRELAAAKAALGEARLVTLTGPGGVGKTRLALEVAERARRGFRDGVWTVELGDLEEGARAGRLEATLLAALPIADQSNREPAEKLAAHLRGRRLLLVLDNCEHVLPATTALVARLLARAPGLHVLATSREPLGLRGERLCVVPPLATPSPERAHAPDGLERFEAVALLVQRARAIDPDFAVTAENAAAVVQLCARLDGVPLAIELAASRLRALSVSQMLERLDRRFQLLVSGGRGVLPRQQSLRSLIDWSFELCSEAERLLWARLSVFPASFDLEAAEDVCGFTGLAEPLVVDVLDRLVAKSILQTERAGEVVRHRLLVTIREYGAERLDANELAVLRRRHRDHFLRRAADVAARWCGPGQARLLASLKRDHPNLVSALEWSAANEGEARTGLELATRLVQHWIAGGFLSEGRRWLDRLLDETAGADATRGDALWVAAWVCLLQGDRDAAAARLAECRRIAKAIRSTRLATHVLHWTGLLDLFRGEAARAAAALERAGREHRQAGDMQLSLTAEFIAAYALVYAGQIDKALEASRSAFEESARLGERWTHGYASWTAGICHWKLGALDAAESAARATLEIQREFQDWTCTALTIELLSWIAASRGDYEHAAALAEATNAVWTGLGTSIEAFGPGIHADSKRSRELVDRHLGGRRLSKLGTATKRISREEAIALALGRPGSGGPTSGLSPGSRPVLSKREREVAGLVAEGMSNRAIAERLFLSVRTVDGHVERILAKLDFTSRTQIAGWVAAGDSS